MVNINNRNWRILLVSSNHPMLMRPSGIYTLGSCDDPTSTIYINENVSNKKLKKVLAHELTHAAIFSYDISLKPEEEELIADLVGTYVEEIINNTNLLFKQIKKNKGMKQKQFHSLIFFYQSLSGNFKVLSQYSLAYPFPPKPAYTLKNSTNYSYCPEVIYPCFKKL